MLVEKNDKPKKPKVARSLTSKNLLEKKSGPMVEISNKVLKKLIGPAECKGCWVIYGKEKNGKTTAALQLAKSLAPAQTTDYISAEEGMDASFQEACRRVGINKATKIKWSEYLPLATLIEKYKRPKSAKVIIIDNMTIYADEFKEIKLSQMLSELKGKLIIFIAHEERKEPYPAVARMAKKLAKVYMHVEGLKGTVVSRFGIGGGDFLIDKDQATLYWGEEGIAQL